VATQITYSLAQKLDESVASRKLIRMLQNTLRRWRTTKLETRKGGFGVFMGEQTYLSVSFSSDLTVEEKRDLLVLFATWLVADPETLLPWTIRQGGSS
jgi:hypothetical protein